MSIAGRRQNAPVGGSVIVILSTHTHSTFLGTIIWQFFLTSKIAELRSKKDVTLAIYSSRVNVIPDNLTL